MPDLTNLIKLTERTGKTGAVAFLVVGLLLIPLGIYLFQHAAGPGRYWPIMLGFSGMGGAFALFGISRLTGRQRAIDDMIDADAPRLDRDATLEALATMAAPFGSCRDCGQVTQIDGDPGRCPQCFSIPGWVYAETDDRRDVVRSNLG